MIDNNHAWRIFCAIDTDDCDRAKSLALAKIFLNASGAINKAGVTTSVNKVAKVRPETTAEASCTQ